MKRIRDGTAAIARKARSPHLRRALIICLLIAQVVLAAKLEAAPCLHGGRLMRSRPSTQFRLRPGTSNS